MPTSFAEELRTRRLSARLSQEELAEAARVSPSAVGAYERGVRKIPHRQTVTMLAEALGLHGDERTAFEAAARSTHRFGRRRSRQHELAEMERRYDALAPFERLLLRRFGTFPESFTSTQACGACAGPDLSEMLVIGALSSLVQQSIVVSADDSPGARLHLSETWREFALEKAKAGGEIVGNLRGLLTWALGAGASPVLAATVIRRFSLAWIAAGERLQFLNWLGTALATIDLEDLPHEDLQACWLMLASGLEELGYPMRAGAARNCALALAAEAS